MERIDLTPKAPNPARDVEDPQDWLEQHGDILFRYAMGRVGNSHLAEDLVQETLLGAWGGREYFDGRASVRTWLVGILRRKLADHFRRLGREQGRVEATDFRSEANEPLAPAISSADFRAEVEREEFREALRNCMEKLPVGLAATLSRRLAGQSADAIADELGLTRNLIGVRLFRARLALRRCLERTWLGKPPEPR